MSKFKLFAISLLATVCVLLTVIYVRRPTPATSPQLNQVADKLFVTSQLQPEGVTFLRRRGFKSIVDIRPDGEAPDQAPSTEIKQRAETLGMQFHYIPVPHGDIPASAVDALGSVLAEQSTRTVLYCRSGSRAVRTLALVQASRTDGPNADAILKMVRDGGFTADDLKDNINQRIAKRTSTEEEKK